ncbi:MAG TPA: hypothetical protein VF668_12900 [Pyrinomonadaceae bacterium]|jgi:hypothetical protein
MRLRPSRLLAALARSVRRAALRAVITGLIFVACLLATLSYLGLPLPDAHDLLERFESVSQLSRALS